jgi:hypothetical protein
VCRGAQPRCASHERRARAAVGQLEEFIEILEEKHRCDWTVPLPPLEQVQPGLSCGNASISQKGTMAKCSGAKLLTAAQHTDELGLDDQQLGEHFDGCQLHVAASFEEVVYDWEVK